MNRRVIYTSVYVVLFNERIWGRYV